MIIFEYITLEHIALAFIFVFSLTLLLSKTDRYKIVKKSNKKEQLPDIDNDIVLKIGYLISCDGSYSGKNIELPVITHACKVFKLCSGKNPNNKDIGKIILLISVINKSKKPKQIDHNKD